MHFQVEHQGVDVEKVDEGIAKLQERVDKDVIETFTAPQREKYKKLLGKPLSVV